MQFNLGRSAISIKQLDTALYHLLTIIKRDSIDCSAYDLAIVTLALCRDGFDRTIYENALRPFLPYEKRLLSEQAISRFTYEAASAVASILRDFTLMNPGFSAAERSAALSAAERRLAFFNIVLGEDDEARRRLALAGASNPDYEVARIRDRLARDRGGSHADSANLLFVIRPPTGGNALCLGRVEPVSARLRIAGEWSPFRKYEPVLSIDGCILDRNDPFAVQIGKAVGFAERHFIDALGKKELRQLPRHYSFALPSGGKDMRELLALTGGSAGLGCTLLALALIDGLKMRSSMIRIRTDAAFTGSIDEEGVILPVDEGGIEAKVRAAFYSPCCYLLIPAANRSRAEEALRLLERLHPARRLGLVTHSNVLEAAADERIVLRKPVPAPKRIWAGAFRKRKHIITAASCASAILALALLLLPRYTREISRCEFNKDTLKFINRYGLAFRSYKLSYHINDRRAGADSTVGPSSLEPDKNKPLPYVQVIDDILPGGGQELLFVGVASSPAMTHPAGAINIHLFSAAGDSLIHVSVSDTLAMMQRGRRVNYSLFELNQHRLHDFNGDGCKELFLLSREHLNNPATAIVVSLKEGAYSTFRHYGHFYDSAIYDINGDGTDEIILAGVHGGPLNAAIVAVLDPNRMEGATPVGLDPHFIPPQNDAAMVYIKLPTSVVCGLLPPGECGRPHAISANPTPPDGIWFGSKEGEHGRSLMFHFDSSLRCLSVEPTGDYRITYERFRTEHNLKELDAYLEDLRGEVEYWDGVGWTRRPFMRSLAACNSAPNSIEGKRWHDVR